MTKVMFVTKGGEYFPPMGIMQISAIAKERGHDTSLGIISKEDVYSKIEGSEINVVAYSGSTGEHLLYYNFNKNLKKKHPEIKSIMGGPHATFFPENALIEGKMDAVCIGEGDYAFPDFLDSVYSRNISNIENIMTTSNTRPKLRGLIQNLDSLSFADRELFYNKGESGDNPIKHFFIGRGCPWDCTYCFNEAFKQLYPKEKYVRRKSVDNVIEEIVNVKGKWPLKFVKFYDDVFTIEADDWLREFADKYPKRIKLPFFCLTRADRINEEIGGLLQRAGCKAMSLSIETKNNELRKDILHRNMSDESIKKGYKICGKNGISIQSNNILGLPGSRIEDDIATLDFNIECGPEQNTRVIAEFGTAHPYPGTWLGDFCEKNKLYSKNNKFKDMHMSYHDASPLNCFNRKEKTMQKNLLMLGPLAVRFPWTRDFIVNYMIKWKSNPVTDKLFFTIFYLNKTTDYMKNVYPLDYSFKDYMRVISQSFKLDWFKRMCGKKWKAQ